MTPSKPDMKLILPVPYPQGLHGRLQPGAHKREQCRRRGVHLHHQDRDGREVGLRPPHGDGYGGFGKNSGNTTRM